MTTLETTEERCTVGRVPLSFERIVLEIRVAEYMFM